jgi:hypothetical protein
MTLNDLTVQFQNLMNRTDLRANSALCTTFITQAILRIQRELRAPLQESTILYTVPSTYNAAVGLAIPNDLLELIAINVGVNQEYELTRGNYSRVKDMAVNWPNGDPEAFARLGGNWIIGPSPNVGDVIMIQYYASFPALVLSTDTNVLLQVAWDAPLYAALSAACDFYDDVRVDKFEKRYSQILQNLQNMADGDELTADAAMAPVYAWPDDGTDD